MKSIGLLIQGGHLLSNGITQQGHYTKLALEACGYDVDLLSTSEIEQYTKLGHSVKVISPDFDTSKYMLIIFVSALLSSRDEQNIHFMNKARMAGCKFVNLICGNIFYLYQEEIIFHTHNVIASNYNTFIDEIWVLPMYTYSLEMLEIFFKKPVRIAPYIWNSDILTTFESDVNTMECTSLPNQEVTLICAEPNMSVHKNAFVPIMIAEAYEHKFNKLNSLAILCGNKLKLDDLKQYLTCKHKIQCCDRIAFFHILKECKQKSVTFPTIVSHQYLNDLNFVHFETLYLGWPLIHNCERLINVGYYYDSHDVISASAQIEYARLNHTRNHEMYMKKVHEFLDTYNPRNKKVTHIYTNLINNLVSDST